MIFGVLTLSEDGVVEATAKGHANEVVAKFHEVATILLSSRGPWRMTEIYGVIPPDTQLDSDMSWKLVAKSKDRGV